MLPVSSRVFGNLKTVQDARQQGTNNKTVYTYDTFDHLQTRTDPLTRQESYVIDQLGNLTSFTDRRGKVATYLYDGINRRTFAGYGTLPGPTYESTINYTYDGGNRLSKIVDSTSGTIIPVFDGLNRLTSETTPQGSVAYQYDNDSRLQTATVSGQPTVNYYFDNASRLYKVAQGSTNTFIGYDNANRRNSLTLPNGIVLTYGYDNDSRINSMSYQLGTTSVGSLTYQYDAAGRRTQMGGSLAATGFPQAIGSAAYDVANELTNWNGTTITPDANGNILNDGSAAYTWNGRNQLTSRGSDLLPSLQTNVSMISSKERGREHVEEQSHGGADGSVASARRAGPNQALVQSGTGGQVCRKCAVRFEPMCANSRLFNTELECFRAGLIVGKLLNLNGAKASANPSDSPTLNQ